MGKKKYFEKYGNLKVFTPGKSDLRSNFIFMHILFLSIQSMEFWPEYWSGLPLPSPRRLPDPRSEPVSPALADRFFTTEPPGKPVFLSVAQVKMIYLSRKTNHASLTPHVAVVAFFRIHP